MTPMPILFAAFAGLLVGSFLNVVALRMPRGVSFVSGSSHCMSCENPVKPWDNIPLFSWLLLRGRCRSCGTGIAARYPLVEAGTAALAAVTVAVHHDDTAQMVLGLVLIAFLVPMALIDLEHRIIPNKLTGPAADRRDRHRPRARSRAASPSGSSRAPPAAGSSCSPRSPPPAAWAWAT